MKKQIPSVFYMLFLLFASTKSVTAAGESFEEQFLGSPLLILVAIIVIDIIAFIYHKLRK
jgi:cadmium resistance protein CadD (predicted permease)